MSEWADARRVGGKVTADFNIMPNAKGTRRPGREQGARRAEKPGGRRLRLRPPTL